MNAIRRMGLLALLAAALCPAAQAVGLTCFTDPGQAVPAQNNFGALNTTKFTLETAFPSELFKICNFEGGVPAGGMTITIIEEVTNNGDTPWLDWHSTLASEVDGILIVSATLAGATGTVLAPLNGGIPATGEASLDHLSVVFSDPIELNDSFTLTQQIFLPQQSGDITFRLMESPSISIGEPPIWLLLAFAALALPMARQRRSSPTERAD